MGAIHYYEKERVFKLDTPHTSYLIGIVDEEGFLGHMYYGAKITDYDVRALMRTGEAPFVPSQNNRDRSSFLAVFLLLTLSLKIQLRFRNLSLLEE